MNELVQLILSLCAVFPDKPACVVQVSNCYVQIMQTEAQLLDGDGSKRGTEILQCIGGVKVKSEIKKTIKIENRWKLENV